MTLFSGLERQITTRHLDRSGAGQSSNKADTNKAIRGWSRDVDSRVRECWRKQYTAFSATRRNCWRPLRCLQTTDTGRQTEYHMKVNEFGKMVETLRMMLTLCKHNGAIGKSSDCCLANFTKQTSGKAHSGGWHQVLLIWVILMPLIFQRRVDLDPFLHRAEMRTADGSSTTRIETVELGCNVGFRQWIEGNGSFGTSRHSAGCLSSGSAFFTVGAKWRRTVVWHHQ